MQLFLTQACIHYKCIHCKYIYTMKLYIYCIYIFTMKRNIIICLVTETLTELSLLSNQCCRKGHYLLVRHPGLLQTDAVAGGNRFFWGGQVQHFEVRYTTVRPCGYVLSLRCCDGVGLDGVQGRVVVIVLRIQCL